MRRIFSTSDDVALGRVVDLLVDGAGGWASERSQLEATLQECVEDEQVLAYLDSHPAAAKALGDRKRLSGVRVINPRDHQVPLVAQVANRIYDLRCRIVHAKEDGDGRAEPIRPFGAESQLLRHDLSLIRFAAQTVLIASSTPATWR